MWETNKKILFDIHMLIITSSIDHHHSFSFLYYGNLSNTFSYHKFYIMRAIQMYFLHSHHTEIMRSKTL